MISPATPMKTGEQVRRNWSLLLQDILLCKPGLFFSSPLHFALNMAIVWSILRFITISTSFYMNVVVNIYEEHRGSMRHFALWQVNK